MSWQSRRTAGDWSCDGGTLVGDTVTLAEGETNVTCTIVNDDVAPTLKLVKTVTTNDGGDAVADDWTLSATAGGDRDISTLGGSGVFETVYSNAGYVLARPVTGPVTAEPWSVTRSPSLKAKPTSPAPLSTTMLPQH